MERVGFHSFRGVFFFIFYTLHQRKIPLKEEYLAGLVG